MYTFKTNLRLSTEEASEETIRYLEKKRDEATGLLGTYTKPVLEDLLNGVHVNKKNPPKNLHEIILNNFIDSLGAEFTDLDITKKG